MSAVNKGSVECVRALLAADGVDVNVQNKVLLEQAVPPRVCHWLLIMLKAVS